VNNTILLGNQIIYNGKEGKEKFSLSEAFRFLWDFIEVHQSATVRTLMEIISSDSEFFQKALMEPFLVDLVNSYRDPLFLKKESNLTAIGFAWWGECWIYKKDNKSFNLSLDVFGKNDEHDNWGIEFSPLDSIIDLPIFVDESISIDCYDTTKSKTEKKKRITPYDDKYDFGIQGVTLIQLLKSFVSEITFCGSEEDKIDRWTDIKERSKEARNAIENGDFEKFTSFEELKAKFELDKNLEDDDLDEDSFKQMMGGDED